MLSSLIILIINIFNMDVDVANFHADHFLNGARNILLDVAADFADVDIFLRMRCRSTKTVFSSVSMRTPSPAPAFKEAIHSPETGARRLTPGTPNAERRAMVVNTSGDTVVLPCV
jgi:hypothetical protein